VRNCPSGGFQLQMPVTKIAGPLQLPRSLANLLNQVRFTVSRILKPLVINIAHPKLFEVDNEHTQQSWFNSN
jgi:hypothetical protein